MYLIYGILNSQLSLTNLKQGFAIVYMFSWYNWINLTYKGDIFMRKSLLGVTALTCIAGMAFMAGCSGDTDETTVETTAKQTQQETEAEETETSETEESIPYVKLEYCEWIDPITGDEFDPDTETPTFTNLPYMIFSFYFSDDTEFQGLSLTVDIDGEEVYSGYCPYYGVTDNGQRIIPLNDAGYVLPGDYTITIYNVDEVVKQASCTVIYDEATAAELSMISLYDDECYITHFDSSDFYNMMINYDDSYVSGGEGIFTKFMIGTATVDDDHTYTVEWTYNGEQMPAQEYSFNLSNGDNMEAYFSLVLPDGQTLQPGTYECNYFYDGEHVLKDIINVK